MFSVQAFPGSLIVDGFMFSIIFFIITSKCLISEKVNMVRNNLSFMCAGKVSSILMKVVEPRNLCTLYQYELLRLLLATDTEVSMHKKKISLSSGTSC